MSGSASSTQGAGPASANEGSSRGSSGRRTTAPVPYLARRKRPPAERLGVPVVLDLVESIVTGRLPVGAPLPAEAALSEQFGVSRTVIRESVKRLDDKGLVEVSQGRSTVVTPQTSWNVMDPVVLSALIKHDDTLHILDELVWARNALESEMAAHAARRATPGDLDEIRAWVARQVADRADPDAFVDDDTEFHATIMRISGRRLLPGITRSLVRHASRSSRYLGAPTQAELVPPTDEVVAATIAEHERILQAIAAGDPDAARTAMHDHIEIAWQRRRLDGDHDPAG